MTPFLEGFLIVCVEKTKKGKCKKVCSVLVFTIDREGRHVEKKAWGYAKVRRKTHEFLIENLAKIDKKNEENRVGNNSPPKNGSWDGVFSGKSRFWVDFGIPGEALGKALGRILGKKF